MTLTTHIRQLASDDAGQLSAFYQRNAQHLRRWEPLRDGQYHSEAAWQARVRERLSEQAAGHSAYFHSFDGGNGRLIATCALTNIVRGPFQACNIGYAIDAGFEGRGLMKQLCRQVIDFAFGQLELNRIMANYMPDNQRSAALLASLGFRQEGRAEKYLLINGSWEDHILSSLLHPRHR
ncbi:GNAT family N-acetyltransferase [Haliea sp. E17]|uniref:GNAT family N-acetyltransferase n=1 Tax=Haliea sp. E17 TaxID=3401576 RepID=UPI003AABA43F